MAQLLTVDMDVLVGGQEYEVRVLAEVERDLAPGRQKPLVVHGDVDVVLVNGGPPVRPHCWRSHAVQTILRQAVIAKLEDDDTI